MITNNEDFFQELEETYANCLATSRRKNADYAGDEDPFKNFRMSTQVGVDPARAILVRISDKISRISNLLDREAKVEDEKLEDTLLDAINYLAILKAFIKK